MLDGFVPFPESFVKKYKGKGYWADKTLGEEFDEFVVKYADSIALSFQGQQVTYRQLGENVNRLALHFVDIGLKTYDRMIFQLPNETEAVFEAIEGERITIMPTPPALLIRWMESELLSKFDLSSFDVALAGGAKLNNEAARRVKPTLGCNYRQNLGMSEGMLFWTRKGDSEELLLNTQGAPMYDDDEIRVVDENDNEVPPGETGELLVRGPYTIRGYYNSPEYNKKAFTEDGFYRTGDVVCLYKDRYVSVEGRIKDTINRGGEKISAEEVENHILAHPKVENCAYVSMPDHELGERGCAFVLTKKNKQLSFEELIDFLKEERHIATFKLPERLELLEAFPMTKVGKIDKKELRSIVREKLQKEKKK
jgi:2,3-dihydroxybenzoate-AMP ligase